eukprot:gene54012-biopygen38401
MRAIRFESTGGPEVLQVVEIDTPVPGPGQILVRHEAIGINFIETYQRTVWQRPSPRRCTTGFGPSSGVMRRTRPSSSSGA